MKKSLFAIIALGMVNAAMAQQVVYSNVPDTLAGNYPSLGYQATSTSEFGNKISLAPGARDLTKATLTMSSWAKQEDYDMSGATTSYNHALTLNIYQAGAGYSVGALIGSKTQTFAIPYRPTGYNFNGIAFNVDFDLSGLSITAPDTFIYGLAFNTQSYGANPIGVDGAYNSLNYALTSVSPTVGMDVDADDTYWNTSFQGFLTTGTAGVFGRDTDWTGYTPMAKFQAVPEPASMIALAGGALALLRRRKKA